MSVDIVRAIVDANRYMTLATADEEGRPWPSPVWYATADYSEFFWVSRPDTRHSLNIAARPQVGIVIFDSHAPGAGQAVYMLADAAEVRGERVERGIAIFSSRAIAQGLPEWTAADVAVGARHRLYVATARQHFILNDRDERLPVSV
jgi:pyridoxine/pyridoxamine 5'-phosphate oxidase